MAMQAGIGASRILILAGAGYTGTILLKNGKLSELLSELQLLLKGVEKSGGQVDGYFDYTDAISQQVKRLAMDVRQLASTRHVTVLNQNGGQLCNFTNLIFPVVTLGVLGYGYMWWKGLKFSDFMYVTKRNMANAVSNLTKNLEQLLETLSAAKVHLTQRIQLLDDKMDTQKKISREIQNDVNSTAENLSQVGNELWQLHCLVTGLDGKIGSLEEKQDLANTGVLYLCNFVGGKKLSMPKALEDQLKPSGRVRCSLGYSEVHNLMGLKELADSLSQRVCETADVVRPVGLENLQEKTLTPLANLSRTLLRHRSARC